MPLNTRSFVSPFPVPAPHAFVISFLPQIFSRHCLKSPRLFLGNLRLLSCSRLSFHHSLPNCSSCSQWYPTPLAAAAREPSSSLACWLCCIWRILSLIFSGSHWFAWCRSFELFNFVCICITSSSEAQKVCNQTLVVGNL